MKNEIDKTVERIGQLDGEAWILMPFRHECGPMLAQKLKDLATAYTQLKADLANAETLIGEYEAMLADTNSILINTNLDLVNICKKAVNGKWASDSDWTIEYDTALEAYAAIKPNAAAGGEGTE